jgi:2'-5' RNA ligase
MPHISGIVTSSLHLTLAFGLTPEIERNSKFQSLMAKYDFSELRLGSLALHEGYRGLYQILWVEVEDVDGLLRKFYSDMHGFIISKQRKAFSPHITLAYVNRSFVLPVEEIEFDRVLKPEPMQISYFTVR